MALVAASSIPASTQGGGAEVTTLPGRHKPSSGDSISGFVVDLWHQRGLHLVRPMQRLVIETLTDGWLDHIEIWRDIEIARAIERRVPNFENLLQCLHAARQRDLRQDRIAHCAERIRDQRRTNQPRRVAGAERDHAPPPALRDRQW